MTAGRSSRWILAGAAVVLLVTVGAGAWWLTRQGSSGADRPSTVWQQQIVEPGVPAGWGTTVGRPAVSGGQLAVTVGGQLTLLSRSSGTVEAHMEGVVSGEVLMLDEHVAVSTQGGAVAVFDREGLGLERGLGPGGPMGGAGNVLLFRGPTSALLAMDVGQQPPVVRWDAEIPGETGSVIAGPVVVPMQPGSDAATVVISRGRQVTALDFGDGSRRWTTQLRGAAAVGWLVASHDTGLAYALDGQGQMTALDLTDGSRRWSIGSLMSGRAPHVQDRTMAVRMSDGRAALFDATDGDGPLWSTAGRPSDAGPVLAGDAVLVGDGTRLAGLDVSDAAERWSVQLLGQPAAITAADGIGYVTVSPGIVYAIDDGQVRWRTIVGTLADEEPGIALVAGPSFALAQDRDGSWRAVDAQTGQPRWTYQPDDPSVMSPPTADTSGAYLTSDSNVIALDPDTGDVRWQAATGFTSRNSHPPAFDGSLLAVAHGPAVVAFDPDGEELWRHTFEARNGPVAVTIGHDAVFATTRPGGLVALSAVDGQPRWQLDASIAAGRPPTVAGGSVIVVGMDGTVRGFDPATGRALWRSSVAIDEDAPITPTTASILAFQDGNILTSIHTVTGAVTWTRDLPDRLLPTGTATIGETAVVATADGALIATGPQGDEAWRIELDSPILTPPASVARRIYIRDINGRLHALE